ncbi:glycosyltransferase family 2 protein [Candidatus Microgenomates bacterium]|nr:glycosyltransferase family 2 protein [Candidatus Microgenomates bacterium]
MSYFFQNIFTRYPIKTRIFLTTLPGFFSWSLILFPIWGSFVVPYIVAYFILFYDVYWLYKSFSLAIIAILAHQKIRVAEKENWLEKAKKLANFNKVSHLVIIPNYQERVDKLRKTLSVLATQTFPKKRIFIILAMEKREKEGREKAASLASEFKNVFGAVFATFHPDLPNEVKGKSSNQAYGARWAYKNLFKKSKLDVDFATVSSVDADSLFDPQYFAYLTHEFLRDTNRYHKFWQSATVYYNNIWKVPVFTRIISVFGSIWRMGVLIRHERLIANATYSLSLKMLVKIGFWDTDVIPEDYRIFFKAFYKLGGKVEAAPIYLKTSMDAPLSSSYWKSLKNKYEQEKRWAWGVSDDPLFIKWWLTVPKISFWNKTLPLSRVLADHFLWPVHWFVITLSANIVAFLNPKFAKTTLGYSLSQLSGFVLSLCLLALLVIIIIDFKERPKRPEYVSKLRYLLSPFEFILTPIAGFFLSTLPAIIAHTRLMFDKRIEYKVTEKL